MCVCVCVCVCVRAPVCVGALQKKMTFLCEMLHYASVWTLPTMQLSMHSPVCKLTYVSIPVCFVYACVRVCVEINITYLQQYVSTFHIYKAVRMHGSKHSI